MLRLVAVEVPVARPVRLEADHGPAPLPDLEHVLQERRLQVPRLRVRLRVVRAAPIERELVARLLVRIARRPQFRGALVEHVEGAPPGQREAARLLEAAPRREIRHVDDLEGHAVQVEHVRVRRQILDDDLHGRRVLGDVDDGNVRGQPAGALGHVQGRPRHDPGPRGVLLLQVEVPAAFRQGPVRRPAVGRRLDAQVQRDLEVGLVLLRRRDQRPRQVPVARLREIEGHARDLCGPRAALGAAEVLGRRRHAGLVVVEERVEDALGHRREARRDEVARGQRARVVVGRVDDVVARRLVRAEHDVVALREVDVERRHGEGLDVVGAVERHEGHVVARDGDDQILRVRACEDEAHAVARVLLHGEQRVGVGVGAVAVGAVEGRVAHVRADVVARHRALEL